MAQYFVTYSKELVFICAQCRALIEIMANLLSSKLGIRPRSKSFCKTINLAKVTIYFILYFTLVFSYQRRNNKYDVVVMVK